MTADIIDPEIIRWFQDVQEQEGLDFRRVLYAKRDAGELTAAQYRNAIREFDAAQRQKVIELREIIGTSSAAAPEIIRWFQDVQEQEGLDFRQVLYAKRDAGELTVAQYRTAIREFDAAQRRKVIKLRETIEKTSALAESAKRTSAREGVGIRTALQVPSLPSDRANLATDVQQGRAALAERSNTDVPFFTTTPTVPPGGVQDISPIPRTPGQTRLDSIEWLDKSRNAWASASEVDRAKRTGDFTNLMPVTADDAGTLLFVNPPGTYEGPTGIVDLDGVQQAILFDESANVYYVPVDSDPLLLIYMGSRSRPGAAPWLALGIVAVAVALFARKR